MASEQALNSFRVLFIDDSPVDRTFIEKMLIKHGFQVYLAEDGDKGIQEARQKHPDLILLDIMLPHLSGIDACDLLKKDSRLLN